MSRLSHLLDGIKIGEPQIYENMRVYPLYIQNGHERTYRTLEEALEANAVEIKEISTGGSVPNLAVDNTGELPILLVVGEELIGAKQNRVLNTSILVPAKSELQIPVSCVEQGRWAYTSRYFASGDTSSHLKLRKMQTENVTSNLRASQRFDAVQSQVWGEVSRKMSAHQSSSTTGALHDVYTQTQGDLSGYLDTLTPPEDAEGILVTINDQIAGADLFDHSDTLKKLWRKLMRSYALDALEKRHEAIKPVGEDTQQFLRDVISAAEEIYASVGLGEDLRLSSERVTGSSLLWGDRPIHTSLFSKKV